MRAREELPPVLIADDDPDTLFLTRRLLLKAGLKNPIVAAPGGAEAIAYLRSSCPAAGARRGAKPAAVFIDLKMPRVTGFHVLRWVGRKRAFGRTWKFVLTTSDHARDRQLAGVLGSDGYIVKYPSLTELIAIVDKLRTPPEPKPRKPRAEPALPGDA